MERVGMSSLEQAVAMCCCSLTYRVCSNTPGKCLHLVAHVESTIQAQLKFLHGTAHLTEQRIHGGCLDVQATQTDLVKLSMQVHQTCLAC